IAAIEEAGYSCSYDRVETREGFLACLDEDYDLIISDYGLPSYDGLAALNAVRGRDLEIPFILVSGTVGEEVAIESLKAGATDYVMKNRLSRLGPVVARALREFQERRQRRDAERSLRESEEKFRAIFQESLDVIMIIDAETGLMLEVNPAARRILGYDEESLTGKHFSILFPPDPRSARKDLLDELRVHGAVFESQGFLRQDGTVCLMDLAAKLIVWGAGKAVLATFRDVTERKHLEEQLHHSQKMEAIGRLAGGVAHDFNNLITAIIGYSQLALNRLSPETLPRDEIEEVIKAGKRAASLTGQLLAFSRKQIVQSRILDINEVVSDLKKMLTRLIGEDVLLNADLDPASASIHADRGHIEQIIVNLAVNARDAMPEGGRLSIRTANIVLDEASAMHAGCQPGAYVALSIADTGTGMDSETQLRIFDPFFTTKEKDKGTGLGLSTVYGIVKQNNGAITVESEIGRGTTFHVYLPAARETEAVSEETKNCGPQTAGNETILLVEDDPGVRQLVRSSLEMNGYRVLDAQDAEDAIEKYRAHKESISLILTDVVMPGMSGRRMTGSLGPLRPDTKVLYMSGYTSDSITDRGGLSSDHYFIQKPFTLDELARKVRESLEDQPAR
ncbi:MAG: response regulator, partial [Acidobacteriota bacterium]